MAIYRRGRRWWVHFEKDGRIFRQSLRTSDWQEAKRKEKELIANAESGKASPISEPFGRLEFDRAVLQYCRDRLANLSESTQRSELDHSKPLVTFFGGMRVNKVTAEMIRQYINARHEAGRSSAKINKELSILIGILKRAKRWYLFADTIKRLKGAKEWGGQGARLRRKAKIATRR